jgi:hypothetical protein
VSVVRAEVGGSDLSVRAAHISTHRPAVSTVTIETRPRRVLFARKKNVSRRPFAVEPPSQCMRLRPPLDRV